MTLNLLPMSGSDERLSQRVNQRKNRFKVLNGSFKGHNNTPFFDMSFLTEVIELISVVFGILF